MCAFVMDIASEVYKTICNVLRIDCICDTCAITNIAMYTYFRESSLQGAKMYKPADKTQTSFLDFDQSMGLHMNPDNRWLQRADKIPWG